jgi:hypothetical protein
MAKKIDKWQYDHLIREHQLDGRIRRMYDKYVEEFTRLVSAGRITSGKPFSFDDFPDLKGNVSKALEKIVSEVTIEIDRATREEWEASNLKNDALVDRILLSSDLTRDQLSSFYDHNLDALSTFQSRKIDGTSLSGRVWNITDQFKGEVELAIDTALGDGRPAATLSRDVRSYLNEPKKLFRRVRDKYGNLVLSKNARAYHPGQGVYRSSYMNAKRLAVSEVNMAYKEADQTRWEQLPIVTGYEVKLSNNHPSADICNDLAGVYPKTFKFDGWHPFCRCYLVSILIDDDEREDLQKRILAGEDVSGYHSPKEIDDVPDGFKGWVKDNASRAKNWSNTPYFIRKNFKEGDLGKGLKLKAPKSVIIPKTPPVKTPVVSTPSVKEITKLPPSTSIPEAEKRFRDTVPGLTIDFGHFRKKDAPLVDQIRESLDYHLSHFPELKDKIKYMGGLRSKYETAVKKMVEDWTNKGVGDWIHDPVRRKQSIESSVKKQRMIKDRSPRANSNTYAYSDPWDFGDLNGIVWNEKQNIDIVYKNLERDAKSKYHPVGCDKPKSIIDHELGHKIDELLGLRSDPEFLKIYNEAVGKGRQYVGDNLSRYAWEGKSPKAEFIAEAWSEYLNSDSPRDIAKAIGELVEKIYKRKYPRAI